MLIDKGVSAGDVVTIKLTSGEELITKLVEEQSNYYRVSKPMTIAATPNGLGLIPYIITINLDKEVKIAKNNIAVIEETNKQFMTQYIESTTNIKLV